MTEPTESVPTQPAKKEHWKVREKREKAAAAARLESGAKAAYAPPNVETAPAPASATFAVEPSAPSLLDRWNAIWRTALTAYVAEPGKAIQRIGDFYDKLGQASKVFFVMEDALAEGRFDPMSFPWPSWEQVSGLNAHGNPVAASAHPNVGLRVLPPAAAPAPAVDPGQDLLAKLAALLGQAPAAPAAPQRNGPTRDEILGRVTGGRPSVPVGEPIRHALV